MTATSRRKAARQEPRVLWMPRPRLILLANVVAFVVNLGAVIAGSGQDTLTNICTTVDKPVTIRIAASGPATAAASVAIVIAGVCILLTVTWCFRARDHRGRVGPVIGIALWLVVFALANILFAFFFGLGSGTTVTCSGGV